jgi:hypothetical protein
MSQPKRLSKLSSAPIAVLTGLFAIASFPPALLSQIRGAVVGGRIPGIVQAALAAAKQFNMRGPNDVYLTVRFVPTAQ